jgi:hypothetical protein
MCAKSDWNDSNTSLACRTYARCRAIVTERGTSLLQAIHAMTQGEAAAGDVAQASQALSDTMRVCLVALMHATAHPSA